MLELYTPHGPLVRVVSVAERYVEWAIFFPVLEFLKAREAFPYVGINSRLASCSGRM
jgi:hypothetical protein